MAISPLDSDSLPRLAGGVALGAGLGYLAARLLGGGGGDGNGRAATGNGTGKKVAVVLAGCGVFDGTEVTEATSVLVHLSRSGAKVECFAPDVAQAEVIDHQKGAAAETEGWSKRRGSIAWAAEGRNVLSESARISRGSIRALAELQAEDFDALVIPGGFGAAKNLSTWATAGGECTVEEDVARVVKAFHESRRAIGMCCIAPVLAAKLIPGVTVTLGHESPQDEDGGSWPYSATCGAIKQLGAKHEQCGPTGVCVDAANRVVTTPAYMFDAAPHQVYDGIGDMVCALLRHA